MKYIYVFLISMLPIIELRGAVVYGIGMNLDFMKLMIVSICGNMIVFPIVFYLAKHVLYLGTKYKYTKKLFSYILEKGHRVGEKLLNKSKYGVYIALAIFVGIPLPGSGMWTGTLAASLLDLDFFKTLLANFIGLLIAFIIMSLFSFTLFGI